MRRLAFILLFACSSSSSPIDGTGNLVTEQRAVPVFHALSITENLSAEIAIGPTSVALEMDDNLVARVATHVENGVLVVEPADGEPELRPSANARLRITTPRLDDISASGVTSVTATSADPISIRAVEDARIVVEGTSARVAIFTTGAARVDCRAMATAADVRSNEASIVRVRATERVSATATEAAAIRVFGNPPSREVVTTDAATVRFEE